MINIEVKGIKKVNRKLTKIKGNTFKAIRQSIDEGANNIQKGAEQFLQANSNSSKWWGGGQGQSISRLDESINRNWIFYPENGAAIKGDFIYRTIGNTSPHAHMVEAGTNSPITSVGGGKLYFWNGDKWISTWSVRGQEGKHYLQHGINMSKDWIIDNMKTNILSSWSL